MDANKTTPRANRTLQTTVNEFLSKNKEIAQALDLFKVSNEQYKSALEPPQRPEFFVTNSTNDSV
jgi:hypothetical protein